MVQCKFFGCRVTPCKGNPCYFPCYPVISYIPCILLVCPHSSRPHSRVFPGNLETLECSGRLLEHSTLHQAPLQGTPLCSPLPRYFLCMCRVILAGFPQSILFGSSLASLSAFLSTARLPLHTEDVSIIRDDSELSQSFLHSFHCLDQ